VKTVIVNFYGGAASYGGMKMGWWNRTRYIWARILLRGDHVHVDVLHNGVHYACLRGRGNVKLMPSEADRPSLQIQMVVPVPMVRPWRCEPYPRQYTSARSVLDVLGLLPKRVRVWNCVQATAYFIGLTDRVRTPRQLRRAIRTRGDRHGWVVLRTKGHGDCTAE